MKIAGRDMPGSQEELMIRFQQDRPISRKKKAIIRNKQHMSRKLQYIIATNGGYRYRAG